MCLICCARLLNAGQVGAHSALPVAEGPRTGARVQGGTGRGTRGGEAAET
jgi:hypothetical protein